MYKTNPRNDLLIIVLILISALLVIASGFSYDPIVGNHGSGGALGFQISALELVAVLLLLVSTGMLISNRRSRR